jgi:hypothetical protein
MDETTSIPPDVADLVERCALHVERRFGLRPDGTPETLSLLDHFIEAVVTDEARGGDVPPGHPVRSHLAHVLAPPLGAFFGEAVRRHFGGRWRLGGDPLAWTVDFERRLLRLCPVAAAAEAILRTPLPGAGPVLRPAPALAEGLRERLALAPGLPEDQFYALGSRFEALQICDEWLGLHSDEDARFSGEDYDRAFGSASELPH